MPDGHAIIVERLNASRAPFTVHEHDVSRTFLEGLERLPFPPELLLKTVAFRIADGRWALVTLHGGDRVDYRALADALGARRADLRQATADEIVSVFGVEIGGVSPIPTIYDVALIFDARCAAMETIYCGTGLATQTLEIRSADLLAIIAATIAPISRAPE